jgi:hypothetical protein
MDGLERGLDRAAERAVEWIPQLLGALLIIVIGHWIAKALAQAVRRVLVGMQLDARLHAGQGGSIIQRAVPSPTHLLERLTYWLLLVGAVSLGATALGIDALNDFIGAIYGYVPEVVAALVIFLIGSAIAAGVTSLVRNTMGDTPTGKMVESIAPVIVIGITTFAILDQLGVAPTIVTITYAALLGSVALGSALAFGLGGQEVAARMLETSYEKGQEKAARAKADLKVGKARAKAKLR